MYFLMEWDRKHTRYSKYLISRFMQMVDTMEIITNRVPVTNGLILLEQINEVSISTLKRPKNSSRVGKIFKEANDKNMKNSIANDVIMEKYFSSTKAWIQNWNRDIPLDSVREIQHQTEIYISIIKGKYVNLIKNELSGIDYTSDDATDFDKKTASIDKLLGLLIAQLVYDGHSLAFLQSAPKKLASKPPSNLIEKLFQFFHYDKKDRGNYLCFVEGVHGEVLAKILESATYQSVLKEAFYSKDSKDNLTGYSFTATGGDPYAAFRNEVIKAFRNKSLLDPKFNQDSYDTVWENAFYSNSGTNMYVKYDFEKNNDPAVVKYRNNTLTDTLRNIGRDLTFYKNSLSKIEEPLHFYHLATTATSIENSYILLWTSLESLMGLRTSNPDISDVTENVKRAISLGAIGRRVSSFANRLKIACENIPAFDDCKDFYHVPTSSPYTSEGLIDWLIWLTSEKKEKDDDPYKFLYINPLLAKSYRQINDKFNSLDTLKKIIDNSSKTIDYQLDRFYFLRNLITHSGRAGKLGETLWIHLEWYLGKLLAQSLEILGQLPDSISSIEPKDLVWSEFRRKSILVEQYLINNKSKKIERDNLSESGIFDYFMFCF